jgi:hypothetical protein
LTVARRALLLGGLAVLAGCGVESPLRRRFDASFFQPWAGDAAAADAVWEARFADAASLGCSEIILQWMAWRGGGESFAFEPHRVAWLLDRAAAQGLTLRLGLPHDTALDRAVASGDGTGLADALTAARDAARPWLAGGFDARAGFAGWYVPLELDDLHWRDAARRDLLGAHLHALQTGGAPLAVSGFYGGHATPESYAGLWDALAETVKLRPMLQDGAGVAAVPAAARFAALRATAARLAARGTDFDIVVELFRQVRADPFAAVPARDLRLHRQLEQAASLHPARLVAFAIEPYLAGALRQAYPRARRS